MCDMKGGRDWTWTDGYQRPMRYHGDGFHYTTVEVTAPQEPQIITKKRQIRVYAGDDDCWYPGRPNPYTMDEDTWL